MRLIIIIIIIIFVTIHTDVTNLTPEEPEVLQPAVHRPRNPQTSLQLFDNYPFPGLDDKEEEPTTWCRALRVRPRSPSLYAQQGHVISDGVDIEDVEEIL